MKRDAIIKLVFISATCIPLATGWINHSKLIAIAGGGFFLLGELAHLVWAYRAARSYRKANHEEWLTDRSTLQRSIDSIWNWISIVGLISMGVGGVTNNDAMSISGGMLWFGRIASYIVGGIITQEVAGIPLRMTYGGWKVDRSRSKHR